MVQNEGQTSEQADSTEAGEATSEPKDSPAESADEVASVTPFGKALMMEYKKVKGIEPWPFVIRQKLLRADREKVIKILKSALQTDFDLENSILNADVSEAATHLATHIARQAKKSSQGGGSSRF